MVLELVKTPKSLADLVSNVQRPAAYIVSLSEAVQKNDLTFVMIAEPDGRPKTYLERSQVIEALAAGASPQAAARWLARPFLTVLPGVLPIAAVIDFASSFSSPGNLIAVELDQGRYGIIDIKTLETAGAFHNRRESIIETPAPRVTLQGMRSSLASIEATLSFGSVRLSDSMTYSEIHRKIKRQCENLRIAIEQLSDGYQAASITSGSSLTLSLGSVPRFLNTLAVDLQSIASIHGVKLILDVSTDIEIMFDSKWLKEALVVSLEELIRSSAAGQVISLITDFEPSVEGAKRGLLHLMITADAPRRLDTSSDYTPLGPVALEACAKAHNGSFNMSTGNSFRMSLTLPRASLTSSKNHISRTIVVVDDDVDIQEYLCTLLESSGFKAIPANDGFDALLVIERHKPDVVLTDIMMPNMGGLDLVNRIKQYAASLPVIVFSGQHEPLSDHRGPYRPDLVLAKPLSSDTVIAAITSLCQP